MDLDDDLERCIDEEWLASEGLRAMALRDKREVREQQAVIMRRARRRAAAAASQAAASAAISQVT